MTPQEIAELVAMVQMMLTTNSPNPVQGAIAPPMDKYGNIEPFDLANQAKAFNVTQDWGDLMSDPAILGGMMPDTITPEMMQPKVTFEPLKGWNQVEATFQNQPNSLEGMIAGKILSGQGAFAAYNDIATILKTPGTEQFNQIAPLVPPRPPSEWSSGDPLEAFDMDAVKKLADSYQSSINSEPVPQRDPETGDFIRDTNGRIATKIEEESPQARWFRETGTPVPWEEWSTNQFASPQQVAKRDESFAKTAETENDWRQFREQRPVQPKLEGADREAYIRNLVQSNMTTPDYPGFTNQTNETPGNQNEDEGGGFSFGPIAQLFALGAGPVASAATYGARQLWGKDIPAALDRNIGDPVENFFNGLGVGVQPLAPDEEGAHIPIPGFTRQPQVDARLLNESDYPGFTNTSNRTLNQGRPASSSRGDAAWATPEGGSRQGKGPARGSRYEAELRLRQAEKDAGPTGRAATPQSKAAWKKTTEQRARNHKQLADEAMRRRMIAMLMANNVTPYTSVMNSRRGASQQAGFGY